MRLLKQIKYDIKSGILVNGNKFFVFTVVLLMFMINYYSNTIRLAETSVKVNLSDYIIHAFSGMKIETYGIENTFVIPGLWLVINFYILIMSSNYPYWDLRTRGYQVMLRQPSKNIWWTSKIIWIILNVLSYYLIIIGTSILATVMFGGNVDIEQINPLIYVVPFIVDVLIVLIAIVISMVINPIAGVIISSAIMIVSAYIPSRYLMGNYSMYLRSSICDEFRGFDFETGGIVIIAAIIVLSVIGKAVFSKKEVFVR